MLQCVCLIWYVKVWFDELHTKDLAILAIDGNSNYLGKILTGDLNVKFWVIVQ
jgi:hypothetical protein